MIKNIEKKVIAVKINAKNMCQAFNSWPQKSNEGPKSLFITLKNPLYWFELGNALIVSSILI